MNKIMSIKNICLSALVVLPLFFISCVDPNFPKLDTDTKAETETLSTTFVDSDGIERYISYTVPTQDETIPDVNVEFDVLTLNDTHGYLETTDKASLSKIAAYMDKSGSDALRISSGDMFQGTGISNLTHGRAIIDAMNAMNFDCMVVGNHEFDWGIETILEYFDGDESNGEANFDLLAANIVDPQGNALKYAKPFIIKNINGSRVGIIGVIGQDLESSISKKSLAGYQFIDVRPVVEFYSKILKERLGCNMVIVATHAGPAENVHIEGLDVDFIVNGHTHRVESYIDGYKEGDIVTTIPCVQSGRYSNAVGHTVSDIDYTTVTIKSIENIWVSSLTEFSPAIDKIAAEYKEALDPVLNTPIATVINCVEKDETGYITRKNVALYTTAFMQKDFNVDAAFVNAGGFRVAWDDNLAVTYSNLLEMIPFDNEMKLCTLTGENLKLLANTIVVQKKDIVSNSTFAIDGDNYYFNGELIDDAKEYKLAVVDYVFDNSRYTCVFSKAENVEFTNAYLRDLLHEHLVKAAATEDIIDLANF